MVSTGKTCLTCSVGQVAIETQIPCPFAPRRRQRDELIYLQGEPATSAWLIKSGVVVLRRATSVSRGRGVARCIRTSGALLGVEALIGDHYLDSAVAGTNLVLCGAKSADVDRWIGPPTPTRALLESSLRAGLDDGALKSAGEGSVLERVAGWYFEHARSEECCSLSRGVVAELLGVRSETLSRALAELMRKGAVDVTRSKITIVDRDLLHQTATGEQ